MNKYTEKLSISDIGSFIGAVLLGSASADAIYPNSNSSVIFGVIAGLLTWMALMYYKLRV